MHRDLQTAVTHYKQTRRKRWIIILGLLSIIPLVLQIQVLYELHTLYHQRIASFTPLVQCLIQLPPGITLHTITLTPASTTIEGSAVSQKAYEQFLRQLSRPVKEHNIPSTEPLSFHLKIE